MVGLEELRKKRNASNTRSEKALCNMDKITSESERVADIAHNASYILDDLDKDFEFKTGLQGTDIAFLFVATALQCIRIYLLNALTKREKASKIKNEDGSLTLEGKIKKKEKEILSKFDNGVIEEPNDFYAPLNQIISNPQVPYDCTRLTETGTDFFQHANHRFSTLGHDPLLGLIFGTANILTNTITITKAPVPGIYTEKVNYNITPLKKGGLKINNPVIQFSGYLGELNPIQLYNTILMFQACDMRLKNDINSVAAALIKQIMHIGTDMFTKLGLQIPGCNLILSPKQTQKLTEFIDTGTIVKTGTSTSIAILINTFIGLLHGLLYSDDLGISRDLYSVRTRKIIMYSNVIASSCNIITTSLAAFSGNAIAIDNFDIGGIMVTIHRLIEDPKYIRQIKKEFVIGNFIDMINRENLQLQDVSV